MISLFTVAHMLSCYMYVTIQIEDTVQKHAGNSFNSTSQHFKLADTDGAKILVTFWNKQTQEVAGVQIGTVLVLLNAKVGMFKNGKTNNRTYRLTNSSRAMLHCRKGH